MKKDKHTLYLQAFINTAKAYQADENRNIKSHLSRLIFYGVRVVITSPELNKQTHFNESLERLRFAQYIKGLMGLLTPKEFVNIFPITKDFKGYKYEMKDYFHTKDYINSLDPDQPIGDDVLEFMWAYMNGDIRLFNVEIMGYISAFRRVEGKPSLVEEWASMNDIDTYTKFGDSKGKEFLVTNNTGEVKLISKPRPKHLTLVK